MGDDHMLNNPERNRIDLWCTKIVDLSIFIIEAHSTCSRTPFVVIIYLPPTKMAAARTSEWGQNCCHAMLCISRYVLRRKMLYGDRLWIKHLTFVRKAESRK